MVKIYGLKVISTWRFLPLATLRPSVSPGKSVVSSLSSQYSGPFFPPHTISSCYLPAPENCPSSKSIVSLLLLHPCKHTSRIKVKCDKITTQSCQEEGAHQVMHGPSTEYRFWPKNMGKKLSCGFHRKGKAGGAGLELANLNGCSGPWGKRVV